jgi:hypothetical protein
MWVESLGGRGSGPALVVAGGPSVERCDPAHFAGFAAIGTNYAHRIWPVGALVVVKDVIWSEVRGEVAPGMPVALPAVFTPPEDEGRVFRYEVGMRAELVHEAPIRNRLVAGRCGATGTAIHLAHLMGHSPVFVVGADLRIAADGKYHPAGYWSDTDRFRPMGWRQDAADCDRVFRDQARMFRAIGRQLVAAGGALYFVAPDHWRHHEQGPGPRL